MFLFASLFALRFQWPTSGLEWRPIYKFEPEPCALGDDRAADVFLTEVQRRVFGRGVRVPK